MELTLMCSQCNTGYLLLDENYVQNNTSGILCVLESNYVENC